MTSLKDRLRPLYHRLTRQRDIHWVCRELAEVAEIKTVVDAGASVGNMTTLFARQFPGAVIHAFEPHPGTLPILMHNIARFDGRVQIHPCGLWCRNGEFDFNLYQKPESSSLLPIKHYMMHDNGVVRQVTVPLRTLDSWAQEAGIESIDFLKIDVEGVEAEVLTGAKHILKQTETVYVEISPLRKGPHSSGHITVFTVLYEAGLPFVGVFGDYLFSRNPAVQAWG